MKSFNKDTFASHLRNIALPPFGRGRCAAHVRQALNAAGVNAQSPASSHAKDWGPVLARFGFVSVITVDAHGQPSGYIPEKGDIAVIQATSSSIPGHMQGYDGREWISDFVQTAFWPGPSYRNEKPAFVIYRRNV